MENSQESERQKAKKNEAFSFPFFHPGLAAWLA